MTRGIDNMKKFVLAGTLSLLLLQSLLPSTAVANGSNVFHDLKPSYWATADIMKLVEKGYMDGYQDKKFKPNQITTRAEAAGVIARTMGISLESDYKMMFTDVSKFHPYYREIRKLAELGIIQDGEWFNPAEPLKRAHISKMIALAYEIEVDQKNKTKFKDLPKTYWAKDYIESLADVDVVKGKTATTFDPNSFVTRAHVAALTVRAMGFKDKVESLEVVYDYLAKDYIVTINDFIAWEHNMIQSVNKIRAEHKLQPLLHDLYLTQLGIIKVQDMIRDNYFEHVSPFYGNPWDMATLFDYEYTSYGENIARNFKTPEAVVSAWMASPKHRDNILKPNFTHIGIGIKTAKNGKIYVSQQFSSK